MIERIQKLLAAEHLTAPQLAERLGVQRSAISHILLGRNKPSFDMLQRFASQFPNLNIGWLITGHGEMYAQDRKGSGLVTTVTSPLSAYGGSAEEDNVPNAALRAAVPPAESNNDESKDKHSPRPSHSLFDSQLALCDTETNRNNIEKHIHAAGIMPHKTDTSITNVKDNEVRATSSLFTDVTNAICSGSVGGGLGGVESCDTDVKQGKGRFLQRVLLLYSDGSFDDFSPKK